MTTPSSSPDLSITIEHFFGPILSKLTPCQLKSFETKSTEASSSPSSSPKNNVLPWLLVCAPALVAVPQPPPLPVKGLRPLPLAALALVHPLVDAPLIAKTLNLLAL